MIDVLKYMHKNYYDLGHPCMALVVDVLENEFHVVTQVDPLQTYSLRERVALVLNVLATRCRLVVDGEAPRPGDVVLMDVGGYHVGICVTKWDMLHIPNGEMGVVCERMDSMMVRNRIVGLYRPTPTTNGHGL